MMHGLIILKNERNNLKTENGKNLTSCEENSRMSEENDEIEIGFICKNLGYVYENRSSTGVRGGVEG